jgi:hypothetical protein
LRAVSKKKQKRYYQEILNSKLNTSNIILEIFTNGDIRNEVGVADIETCAATIFGAGRGWAARKLEYKLNTFTGRPRVFRKEYFLKQF